MNKHLYRIVFNKRRGQLMVVGETATAQGKAAAGETGAAGSAGGPVRKCLSHPAWRPLCLALSAALGSLMALPSYAQIVGDPSAPGAQRPTVLVTNSGVPQVDIQTPSAAGVSRNTYTQFDVGSPGAILNNSRTDTQTQLGGWIHGNSNLASGSARVILNEVNSSNPSVLGGFVEVAGQRAEVVIANPAGLKIDGGGFINASRVTLTTGTPLMNGGSLEGYAVRRGVVTITGRGLDASQADYTAILARAAQLNAGIWAQELRVVTGANQLDATHNVTAGLAPEGETPVYALDVAQLGGMYAGKIMLIGTEAGLGVRNAGTLAASAGELALDANGWLSNSGTLQAAGKLALTAASDVANSGAVRGATDVQITTGGNIANSGSIGAAGNLALSADGAQSRIDSGAGSLLVAGLNADGLLGGAGALEVRARDAVAVHGSALAGGTSTFTGNTLDVGGATLNAGAMSLAANSGDLDLAGTRIVVTGQLDLNAAGMLRTDAATIGGGQLTFGAASLSNVAGDIRQTGSGDLAIRLPGLLDNTDGHIATNSGDLSLGAQVLANGGGTISHAGTGTFTIDAARFDGHGGSIASNGALDIAVGALDHRGASARAPQLTVHADSLDNSSGTIEQTGAGQATLSISQDMNNTGGAIRSSGSLALSAGTLENGQGHVGALRDTDLRVTGKVDNSGGSIAGATLALHAGDLRNAAGAVQAVSGDGSLVVGTLDNGDGSISAAGDLRTSASSLANSGSLYAGGSQDLMVSGGLTNSGMIAARGDTTVTAASLAGGADSLLGAGIQADGSLAEGGALRVTAAGTLASQGQLVAAAATLSGGAIDLSHSRVQAADVGLTASAGSVDTSAAQVTAGTLAVSVDAAAGQGWRNAGGQVQAGQLALQSGFLDNTGGSIVQTGAGDTALALTGPASLLNNTGGRIAAAGANVSLRADTVLNAGGKLDHTGSSLALHAGRFDNAAGLVRTTGTLTLDAGSVGNRAGELSAGGDLLARLEGDLDSSGLLYAGRNLSLDVAGALDNAGTITALGDAAVAATSVNSNGLLYAGRNLTLDVAGALDNAGTIAARGDAAIAATSVNSSGLLGAGLDAQGALGGSGSLAVSATGKLATSGQDIAAGSLRLQGGSLDLAGSRATATEVTLAAGSGAIDTSAATVQASDTLAVSGGDLHNGGGQLNARAIDVDVAALDNTAGAILQAGQGGLHLHTGALENGAGRIAGDGSIAIQAGSLGNAGGTVSGAQGVTLAAGDVDNRGGQIRSAAGDVALALRDLANDGGAVFAGGRLTTTARNVDNGGSLYAAESQTLASTGVVLNSGAIAAGGDTVITAATLASRNMLGAGLSVDGVLAGSGSLTVSTGGALQSNGRNLAAGKASLAGASLDLSGSETVAADISLAATSGGIDTGAGLVSTSGTLSAAAPGTLANHGGVLSAGQLDLRVGAVDNAAGSMLQTGSGDTVIRTGSFDNTGGRLAVNSRNLHVDAAALSNAGGRIEHAGSGLLQVEAGAVDNHAGHIESAGSATIASSGAFDNSAGTASAAGDLHLSAGAIDNSGGLMRAAAGTLAVDGGSLHNADGELSAGGDLRVDLAGDLRSSGLLYAGGAQTISLGGVLGNSGVVAALGDTTIVADSVTSTGLLGAGLGADGAASGSGKLSVTSRATVASGQNTATGDLAFKGGAIDLSGSATTGADVTLDAGGAGLATRGALVTAKGKAALTAGSLDNLGGQVAALGGDLVLDAGKVGNRGGLLQAAGHLAVDAADVDNTSGEIRADGAGLVLAVRDLDNTAGAIFANGDLAATARNIGNSGSMYAAGSQTIAASGALNSSGVIAARGNTTITSASLASSGLLGAGVRADGTLAASGDLTVSSSGALQARGDNLAAGNASFAGATLDLSGSETSGANVRLGAGAGQVDTSRALVTTTGTLTVDARAGNGGLVNAGGALSAGQLDLQASSIHNAGGTILQTGSGNTAIDTGALDNSGGRLAVNSGNLHVGADTLDNTGGRIEHAGAGTLAIGAGTLANGSGHIISGGAAEIATAASLDNADGVIAATSSLRIGAGAIGNQGGLIQAKTGALTMDAASFANGDGEASAGGDIHLSTSGDLGNEGLLYAGGALGLNAGGTLRNSGSIAAQGNTVIGAGSVQSSGLLAAGLQADGSFATGGDLRVTSVQTLAATGQNLAAGDVSLQGARIDLSGGQTSAVNVTISAVAGDIDTGAAVVKADGMLAMTAAGALRNAGGALSAGRIALDAASLDNHAGDIVQTGAGDLRVQLGALDNTGGRIAAAAGRLDVAASTVLNTGGALLAASGLGVTATTVDNAGGDIRAAGGDVALSADTIVNGTGGSVYAAGNLDTHAGTLDNRGSLYAAGHQTLTATGAVNNDGSIAAQGNTRIAAVSLGGGAHALLGAGMRADGTLLASGDLSVDTQGVAQAHGQNLAGGNASIQGSALDLSGSETGAANVDLTASSGGLVTNGALVSTAGRLAIDVRGALDNVDGILSAGQLALSVDSLDNTRGTIMQGGSGDTVLTAGVLNNTGGWIGVNSTNLRIEAASLDNAGGTIQHAGGGTLTVRGGTIDNRNGVMRTTRGSLALDAVSLATSGEVSAGGDLHLSVAGDLANDGLIYAGGNQTLGAGGLLHGSGSVAASGNLDVDAGRIDSTGLFGAGMRADGSLVGAGNLSIASGGSLKAGGDKLASGNISLRGAGVDLSRDFTGDPARPLTAGASITVDGGGGTIDTSGAVLSSAGDLALSGAALVNRHGELGGARVGLALSNLDNADGVIVQNGAGDMTVSVAALDNTGGRITAANGNLALTAAAIDNTQGTLAAAGSLRAEGGADLVNEGGRIQGVAGDVTLHVRDLRNDGGSVFAGHDLATTARDVDNGGSLFAAGSQTLAASGAVASDGVIAAQGDVTLSAASLAGGSAGLLGAGIRADGSLAPNGNLSVTATQALQAGGQVLAGGNANLSGASVDLRGSQASAANITLTAGSGDIDTRAASVTAGTLALTATENAGQGWRNAGGDVLANQLQVQVANLDNAAGSIIQTGSADAVLSATGTLDNSGGRIAVNGTNLALRADTLSNAGGSIEHAGHGALTIEAGRFDGHDGAITGNGSVSLAATDIDHRNAALVAQQVDISAATLDNSLGQIIQRGSGQTSIAIANALNNRGGRIGSNGSTAIVAGSLDNAGGELQAGGTANLNLNVGGLLANTDGARIAAGGDAVVSAGAVDNRNGMATAAGTMTLGTGGMLSNAGGTLASQQDLVVSGASLDNTAGHLASVGGNLTLGTTGATTNTGGHIQAAGVLGIANAGMANGAGGVVSGRDVSIDTGGQDLDNHQGTIAATAAASLQTGAVNNDGGRVQSGTTLVIDTHGQALTNSHAAAYAAYNPGYSGGITGGTATTLYAGTLDNTAGFLASGGEMSGSMAYLVNAGGEVAGMAGIGFTIGGLNNQGGRIQALGSLAFNAGAGAIDNRSGLLRAGQALTLDAGAIDNGGTLGTDQGIEAQDLVLTSAAVDNSGGTLRANNNVTINSTGAVGNGAGLMSAMNSLSILDAGASRGLAVDNAGGLLIGGQMTAIRAASLGGAGRVLSQQDLTLDLAGSYALEAGAEVIGNRNVTLNLGGGLSNAGKLQAGGTLALTAASLDNGASGDINAANTRINAGGWLTNRGVIDGINTDIDTGALTNLGTGRIYGDRIGIAAGSVVNDAEGGTAGTIAARGYLALGASTISNQEHALIFSGGDMAIGGSLDANRSAQGSADSLTNGSATVEALGSLNVSATRIDVLNNHFSGTTGDFGPSVMITEYFRGTTDGTRYTPDSGAHLETDTTVYDHLVLVTADGRDGDFEERTTFRSTASTVVQSSDPGVLAAGNNLTLNSGEVLNENSQIVAGLSVNVAANVLTNRSTANQTVVREHVTLDHHEFHGVLDLKPGYFDSPTNWSMTYDNPDVVIDNAGGFTFQYTPSSAPAARAAVSVNGSTSAARAATANQVGQVAVSGPALSTAAGTVNGQLASAATGASATVDTTRLGGAGQTGPLQTVIHNAAGAALAQTQGAGTAGPVGTPGSIGAAGPVANATGTAIGDVNASVRTAHIGARKTAGESGTVVGENRAAATAAIDTAGGILLADAAPKASIAVRSDAGTPAGVTGVNAATGTAAVASTVSEPKVSEALPSTPRTTTLAAANGSGPAPASNVASGGPTPGAITPNVRGIAQVSLANPTASAEVVRTSTEAPVVPNASLYHVTPAPSAAYLVQTDPRFTDYREWTSADYLTSKVPTDPSVTQKRLGDGFYEQQLVREQMTALTGYRYGGDYTSDEAQYRGLMDAAASFASTWNLRPGVALTPAQMASLTSDIVWLVEQDVTLADGSTQKVLVPQVYVRVREGDLDGSGALLSGKEVNIALTGDLTNSGTIAGRQVVRISAENIDNLSGRIHGDDVTLQATKDLNNISGTISANTSLVALAGRDINNATGIANITHADATEALAGRVAGLYITGGGSGDGSLLASAGRDINLAGGIVSNTSTAGTTLLAAQRNLNLSAAQDSDLSATRLAQLSAGGTIALKAGADLNIANATSKVGSLQLHADNDINNIGNVLSAENSLIASAGRDINLRTTTSSISLGTRRSGTENTSVDQVAGLSVTGTGADGKLIVSAGRDINLAGAGISNAGVGGITALSAVRDLNLGTVGISSRVDTIRDANNYRKENSTSEVGSAVSGAGSILLGAGNNLNVRAGQVDAGTALNVAAGNDINVTTGTATYALDQSSQTSKSGFWSKKVTTQRDTVDTVTATASTLTGGTVDMNAGKDLNVTGSAVVGEDGVKLAAGNDINIAAAIDTNREWNHIEEKKSGFLTGGGGFGISYGTRTTTTDQNRDAVTQSGQARSMVGSIGGDLTIEAGNAIKASGTDMSAGQDMRLVAKDVTIDPGKDKIDTRFETRVVQDAMSLRVGGSIVNAVRSVQDVQQTAQATDNKRVQAMAAATAAMAAKDAAADYARNGLSVNVSLTAGHSESVQTTTTSETLHTGSLLTAGRDVSIVAKGEGASGDINVIGSDIKAGRDVQLAAGGQVNLAAAQDLESQHSVSKSISGEAGVAASYSAKNGTAIGLTASLSASNGHDDGEGTTQVNGYVDAGQTLTIASGGDTNIKGAVASANRVVADVGGNLNIASLQDTAKFDSKTLSASVSGTVGYGASVDGSLNRTAIESDYASVQEQSGIKAGDGGFQIKVGGNTDLKGAVISSTEAGTAANSLVTKTLTQSGIENHASMEGSSIGLSGGASVASAEPAPKTGAGEVYVMNVGETGHAAGISGIATTSSNEASTTRSGISAGSVTVADGAAQGALAGVSRDVVTGSDSSGRIANKFDANATNVALSVSGAFTAAAAPIAANLVGNIAQEKQTAAELQARIYNDLADQAGDTAEAKAYRQKAADAKATADSWGDNGLNRLALHSAAQGLIGGLSNGGVGALTNVAGVAGGNLGQQLGAKLGKAAAAQQHLNEDDTQKLVSTYQETLATVGGALAGMAASGTGANAAQDSLASTLGAGHTANTIDVYNRQLHADEIKLLQKLAQGKNKEDQQKLVDAACALVHCSSGLINGPEKEKLEKQEEKGKSYKDEQSLLLKTGQFRYGMEGYAEDAGSRVYNEAKSLGRGAYNLGYLLATHGPYGNVQTPDNPFDDHNGPKLGGGTVTAFPIAICAPGLPVGTCTVAPPLGVGVGLRGGWPSNALLSDGGDTGWNGNSTISSEAAPASGANNMPAAATTGEGSHYVPSTPLAMRKVPGVGDVPMRLPEAEGLPHSVLGGKLASDGETVYRQTATFDGGTWPNPNGIDVPWGRVDWTSHPYLPGPAHPNPHIHEFVYDFTQGQWRSTSAKPFFGH